MKKFNKMLQKMKAFTLIELVIVIVIVGILAAVIVPQFRNLSDTASAAALQASTASVESTLAIYIGETQGQYPTVTQLASRINNGTAAATGIQITLRGTVYTIPTYTDTGCTTATSAVGNTVQCIGSVS